MTDYVTKFEAQYYLEGICKTQELVVPLDQDITGEFSFYGYEIEPEDLGVEQSYRDT